MEKTSCLYEHQSSYCPNMPLRGFFYFADLYKKLLKDVEPYFAGAESRGSSDVDI